MIFSIFSGCVSSCPTLSILSHPKSLQSGSMAKWTAKQKSPLMLVRHAENSHIHSYRPLCRTVRGWASAFIIRTVHTTLAHNPILSVCITASVAKRVFYTCFAYPSSHMHVWLFIPCFIPYASRYYVYIKRFIWLPTVYITPPLSHLQSM